MKQGIHPELKQTKVTCLGCKTTFETISTVDTINIEICSACHPFYTGKQKLVDTAGRVDRFQAQKRAAKARSEHRTAKKPRLKPAESNSAGLAAVKQDIKSHTVDSPKKANVSDDEE